MRDGGAKTLHVFFERPRADAFGGVGSEGGGRAGGGEDLLEGAGESGDVAGGVDEAFDAVGDEVGVGAYVVGRMTAAAGCHDFVDDEAPGLMARGEDEDVGELEEAGEGGLILEAGESRFEARVGAVCGFALCFEVGTLFAVANDNETGGGGGGVERGDEGGAGVDELVAELAGLELGGEEDDGAVGLEVELGAEEGLVGSGFRGAAGEEVVVDRVGHQELRNAIAEVVGPVLGVDGADGERGGDE